MDPPSGSPARFVRSSFDAARPAALAVLLRLLVTVALWLAAPFFAAAILFALLDRSWVWIAVPATIGGMLLGAALVVWAVAWWKLRQMGEALARAEAVEGAILVDVPPR